MHSRFSISNTTRIFLLFMALHGLAAAPAIRAAAVRDQWVYLGTYTTGKSQGIYVSRMDAAGKLAEPQLVARTTNPSFLAVDSTHRFLYAVSEVTGSTGKKEGDVAAYAINIKTGQLTELNRQPSGGETLCHVEVDRTGKTVLAASYGGGSVTAFPVNADGSLGQATSFIQHHGSSVNPRNQAGPHAHCIVTDPANRFALACDLGLDKVLVYKLDANTATLTTNTPAFTSLTPGVGPRHLAFHPNGKFVYVVNEMGCSVTAFAYGAKRSALSEIQTISTLAGQAADPAFSGAEVVVHPAGRFLYSSTRGLDVINIFSVNPKTGKLAHLENVPSGGKTPRNFNLDSSGRFLLAANQNSDNVVVFQMDPATGRLTPTGSSLAIGNPSCVVFVPVP